jgi:NAD+ synthase (glutamine-hydrolysing)
MLITIGAPVANRGLQYNCIVFIQNGKIIHVKPKVDMSNDGAYREPRWFTCWHRETMITDLVLPRHI